MESIKQRIARYQWKTASGRVIPMGVGCAYLGGNHKEVREDPMGDDIRLLERCYEAGFRFFDTSADYGESEDVLGGLLKNIDRKSIFLATKSPYRIRQKSKAEAFEEFKTIFYKSFERMGVDHIDLYQIHDTNDFYVCVDEVIPFLQDRKAEGMIDYIGMGTRDLVQMSLGIRSGAIESALSYLEYSILKTAAQPLIETAKRFDAAFINASTLHFGAIKAEDPMTTYAYSPGKQPSHSRIHIAEAAVEMQALLKQLNVPVIAAALQISLFNHDIDITLNGISRASNLVSTLEAMDQIIYPEQWTQIFKKRDELPFSSVQDMP